MRRDSELDNIKALHTAARRYSSDRREHWERRYVELLATERLERQQARLADPVEKSYSRAALDIFPRYRILKAIQDAVETSTPEDFESLTGARAGLTRAGLDAKVDLGDLLEIEEAAMIEEKELFARYVQELPESSLRLIEPLPFRRKLRPEEGDQLWRALKQRWGIERYWYPLDRERGIPGPPNTVAFHGDAFRSQDIPQVLRSLGIDRVWVLGETANEDYELDVELLQLACVTADCYWIDRSLEWLIYASHENTVTVSGNDLLATVKEAWPDWSEHVYDGRKDG